MTATAIVYICPITGCRVMTMKPGPCPVCGETCDPHEVNLDARGTVGIGEDGLIRYIGGAPGEVAPRPISRQ